MMDTKIKPVFSYALFMGLSLLLYLSGICGLFSVYGDHFLGHVKEGVVFYVELEDWAKETEVYTLQERLEKNPEILHYSVRYISKKVGMDLLMSDSTAKEESLALFEENLLPNMLAFQLKKGAFANHKELITKLETDSLISEVFFAEQSSEQLAQTDFDARYLLWILALCLLLIMVALLITATRWQALQYNLQEPTAVEWRFWASQQLRQRFIQGLLSSLLAMAGLWGTYYAFNDLLKERLAEALTPWVTLLSIGVAVLGLMIPWVCTKYILRQYKVE